MKLTMAALVCATALGVAACGPADDTRPAGDAGMGTADPADRTATEPGVTDRMAGALTPQRDLPEFIEEAAMANMAEIQLSQLAQKRTQNQQVRQFAQRMVNEHQKALEGLRTAAKQANVQLPNELDQEHRQKQERLQGLKGAEFDREYMNMMVEAHEDTVELLEERADQRQGAGTVGTTGDQARADDGQPGAQQVNTWAQQTLPTVQQHLQQARQLQQQVGDAGAAQGGQMQQPAAGQQQGQRPQGQ
jgi:putative membrane protein